MPLFGVSIITLNAIKADLEKSENEVIKTVTTENELHDNYEIPTEGEFEAKKNDNLICIDFLVDVSKEEGENMTWSYKKCFTPTAFSALPTAKSDFEIYAINRFLHDTV